MRIQTQDAAGWAGAQSLPAALDCETAALMRQFLGPLFEMAKSWTDLSRALAAKGFQIAFRDGRLLLLNSDTGLPICTGRAVGYPLKTLSQRLGRPCIRVSPDGHAGRLNA